MRFFKVIGFFLLIFLVAATAVAKKNRYEKKGRFGLALGENFVTLDYVITYLNESYKPGHLTFRIDLEDAKGLDLAHEVVTL